MPDAYLAQISLLPGNAYAECMRLINRALELNPGHAGAYGLRASELQLVGRMKDAVVDARRAVELDPLSPRARGGYVYVLANAGRYDTAVGELREMERLWPGASTVADIRFFLNLRYGDPVEALAHLRANPADDWMNGRAYLEARADPTPANIERAIGGAQRLYRERPRTIQNLIQLYTEFDREKDLVELLLKAPLADVGYVDLTFRPPGLDFWRDPRALLVARRAGLLDYWRESGQWPDFCFAADLPYDCRTEASKVGS